MSSVDQQEIENFSKDSARWWDETGPFKPLHKLNPVRLSFIKNEICTALERDANNLKPLKGLDIFDIGCGGGLVCEPLARLGANVTGADADAKATDTAKKHAAQQGLSIDYQNKPAEEIKKTFDVVLALEIIEHVSNPEEFIASLEKLLKPGGLLIMSTLNRSPKSYALGIIAAEYILRWVPRGTHSWKKFIRPSELVKMATAHNLKAKTIRGLVFNPFKNEFALSKTDLDVNYLVSFSKNED